MTEAHYEPIRLRLQLEGFNVEAYEHSGQLIFAQGKSLAQFMSDGVLNTELFKSTISGFIALHSNHIDLESSASR